jgi:uncharacterized protein
MRPVAAPGHIISLFSFCNMLLIDARAGKSDIHGIGLIANQFIPKGTRMWTFKPGFDLILSEKDINSMSEFSRSQVIWYAYYDKSTAVYVLSSDDDRFTNHSDSPNTINIGDDVFALVDIYPGTEITWDYRNFTSGNES